MHRLRIILEVAARGLQSGFKAASGAVRSFLSGLANMARSGRKFIDGLAQSVFFLGAVFDRVSDIARKLFDRFIGGAGDAAKLEAKLKNIVGSSTDAARIMEHLDQVSQDTGISFEELARGAGLTAVAAKDASGAFDFDKFKKLTDMLLRISALRPDVPVDRLARGLSTAVQTGNWASLEMFLDVNLRQLVDIADAAEDVADVPGQIGKAATFIELDVAGAADEALKSIDLLDEALKRAGATAGIVRDIAELSGMERFNETLQSIARTVGEPLFEALNEGMSELSDWLQENPELIEDFATALGKLGAAGIEKVFESITKMLAATDWEKFFSNATEFFDKLASGDIEGAFKAIQLGDLGEDIGEAAITLGEVVVALGKIADLIIAITGEKEVKDVGSALVRAASVVAPGGAGYEEVAKPFAGILDNIELIAQKLLEPVGLAVPIAPQELNITVEVTSDDAMFDARVRQAGDDAVIRGFDEVHQNYKRKGR